MRRCIAIGGVPGTGKTTLMLKFMGELPELKEFRKLVKGHDFGEFVVLGDYSKEGTFKGTDTFSMAVQPEAEAFFAENKVNVVYEGDRIFNGKMLTSIGDLGYELLILIIEANPSMLQGRYDQRGSDQSEKFLAGRRTKYENIKNDGTLTVHTAKHEIPSDTMRIVEAMRKFLKSGEINTAVLTKVENDSLGDFFS